jgi:aromatic-L-amino-acid decarboxylase
MLDLPEAFRSTAAGGGVIQDTASTATLCALLAARERATGFESNRAGLTRRLVAYASSQAHSLVEKAVMIAGLGRENLRLIECDERFAMRPERLQEAIDKDRSSGGVPCFVCATVGTTSSHALDPLGPIGEICRTHGLWLHVDALEGADSYCFNPHKWMFTNFDCDCFWVADRAALIRTMDVLPEYLRTRETESGAVFDYRNCGSGPSSSGS